MANALFCFVCVATNGAAFFSASIHLRLCTFYFLEKGRNLMIYFLILVIAFILKYFIAGWFFEAAEMKGYHDRKYFHICFWLGSVGYLLVIALPDRGNGKQSQRIASTVSTVNPQYTTPSQTATTEHKQEPAQTEKVSQQPVIPIASKPDFIKCPSCGFEQPANRNACWSCGQRFIRDDQ